MDLNASLTRISLGVRWHSKADPRADQLGIADGPGVSVASAEAWFVARALLSLKSGLLRIALGFTLVWKAKTPDTGGPLEGGRGDRRGRLEKKPNGYA